MVAGYEYFKGDINQILNTFINIVLVHNNNNIDYINNVDIDVNNIDVNNIDNIDIDVNNNIDNNIDNIDNNINNNIDNKIKNSIDIVNLNILTSYSIDYESDEKKDIKNIFLELSYIKNIFNKNNLIEILKLFKYKNNNDINNIIIIFNNIFKIMSEEFINNYLYLLMIFEFLKLYKNKYNIINIVKKKDIDLSNFYKLLKSYFIKLSSKSELLKLLLLIGKQNISIDDLKLLFILLSKEMSNHITFNEIYEKILEYIEINDYNIKFINENLKNAKIYYNEIYNNLNDLYYLNCYNKYKINTKINDYFNNILLESKKIICI